MAKPRGVDARLHRLRAIRQAPITPDLVKELRSLLADASNLVVADAAEIVGERSLVDLAPDIAAAFERFMIEPEKSDKLCRAKIALVEALNKLDHDEPGVLLIGLQHRQEPMFGTHNDTAGPLRANCAFGLVRINYRGVLILLADMLLDQDIKARTAAVTALGETGAPAALPLLRFKARLGDADPTVTGESLSALIRLDPFEMLPFVADFLHSGDEAVQEGAALALAESRRPEALQLLKDFWPHAQQSDLAETLLLAIAMLRLPGALDFLLEVLADRDQRAALAALSALAIHRHNDALRDRIAVILGKKNDLTLTRRFEKKFGNH